MAYLRDLSRPCYWCNRNATKELFNYRHASNGFYCTKHAKRALDEQIAREKENPPPAPSWRSATSGAHGGMGVPGRLWSIAPKDEKLLAEHEALAAEAAASAEAMQAYGKGV